MTKLIATFSCLALANIGIAQINLVPNYSFEDTVNCPNSLAWIVLSEGWYKPSYGTPDYFNNCSSNSDVSVPQNIFGYQNPLTGNAYAGLATYMDDFSPNYREYVTIKLDSPLIIGTKYFITFNVSLADSCNWTTDEISLAFTEDSLSFATNENIPINPQIENVPGNFITTKNSWTKITGSFIADSNYNYILIGNFNDLSDTDTLFVSGGGDTSVTQFTYFYLDDVCVSTDSLYCFETISVNEIIPTNDLTIFPNPTSDQLEIRTGHLSSKIFIVDINGKILFESTLTDGNTKIEVSALPAGVYYVHLITEKQTMRKAFIKL